MKLKNLKKKNNYVKTCNCSVIKNRIILRQKNNFQKKKGDKTKFLLIKMKHEIKKFEKEK
jgi:hypothetical protein